MHISKAPSSVWRVKRSASLGLFFVLALLIPEPLLALEVAAKWGYDGTVVPGQFNPLTIRVRNDAEEPFVGELKVQQGTGMRRLGMPIVERIYLSPGAERRVRFYPRIASPLEAWQVQWGAFSSEALPALESGPPAVLCVVDNLRGFVPPGFTPCEATEFPDSVLRCMTIEHVLLDSMPAWSLAQRSALLDWLHAGGTLHILRSDDGKDPVFTDELSVLSERSEGKHPASFGAGRIVRHENTRREIARADVTGEPKAEPDPPDGPMNSFADPTGLDRSLFAQLGFLTTPHHSWPLIITLAILFLVAVVPVGWIIGRRSKSFWTPNLYLLSTITLFSAGFFFLGQRGYGETEQLVTLTYARPIEEARFAVTQWSHAFVTRGQRLTISPPGQVNLFAPAVGFSEDLGAILHEAPGVLVTDVPLFSSRDFVHAGVREGRTILDSLTKFERRAPHERGNRLKSLEIQRSRGSDREIRRAWAVYDESVFKLDISQDRLELGFPAGTVSHFLRSASATPFGMFGQIDHPSRSRVRQELWDQLEEECPMALMAHGLRTTWWLAPPILNEPQVSSASETSRVDVFVLTDMPDSFRSNASPPESGFVVYHYTFAGEKE